MPDGPAGIVFTDTLKDCAVETPQLLPALTVIVPADELAVAEMELVEEVPLHPAGNVQL